MMILEFLGICLVNAIITLVSGRPYKWSIVIISWVLFELIYAFFFYRDVPETGEATKKNQMEENNYMSEKEKAIIEDNLRAYENNFGYIKIVKEECGKGFYVFTSEERSKSGCWTQFCYNIDYLNGWLYGCVQAANGVMKKIAKK